MREQINTFETVFNVEQFLVRLVASDLFGRLFTLKGLVQNTHGSVFLWEHPHGLIKTRQLVFGPSNRKVFPQVN